MCSDVFFFLSAIQCYVHNFVITMSKDHVRLFSNVQNCRYSRKCIFATKCFNTILSLFHYVLLHKQKCSFSIQLRPLLARTTQTNQDKNRFNIHTTNIMLMHALLNLQLSIGKKKHYLL